MKNFFKGFLIGIGKIVPGVSGAMLAISMGVYDKGVNYINNFKSNQKEATKYLLPIGLGILLSIIIFSKIINYALNKFYLITMLFFIGLIIGGLPSTIKKVSKKEYFLVIISFIFFFLISIMNINNSYIIKNNFLDIITFFISGIMEAIGTVVPGVSGTALLMIAGTYNIIISSLGNIFNFSSIIYNLKILIPFVIGLTTGIILIVKLISYLFSKYQNKVYGFILGVLLSSIVLLIVQSFKNNFKIIELIIGIIFMFIGIFIATIMEEK